MKGIRFIEPLRDFTFKTIWLNGSKDSKEYLQRIVSYLARKDIRGYSNANCELGGNNYISIQSVTDLILVSKDRLIKINVEVNRRCKQ